MQSWKLKIIDNECKGNFLFFIFKVNSTLILLHKKNREIREKYGIFCRLFQYSGQHKRHFLDRNALIILRPVRPSPAYHSLTQRSIGHFVTDRLAPTIFKRWSARLHWIFNSASLFLIIHDDAKIAEWRRTDCA